MCVPVVYAKYIEKPILFIHCQQSHTDVSLLRRGHCMNLLHLLSA